MARIAGINIPPQKHAEIGLTAIFGIGRTRARKICEACEIDYSKKINAKVKALAFSRALFDRASAGEIAVIEKFIAETGKTKGVNQIVGRIAPAGKVLLVDAPFALGTARAARNIDRVYLQEAAKLNPVDLAKYKKIIVSTKALETIIARINGGKN